MAPSSASHSAAPAGSAQARLDLAAQARDLLGQLGVRPGASPIQNGTLGGAPWASATRTVPASTRRMRQEVLPSRKMSPDMLSMAKSSSRVPTCTPSGSATTA